MRYIGRNPFLESTLINPNKNSLINVRGMGASGLGNYFTGKVRGVENGSVLTIGDIDGFLSHYQDNFKVDQEIQAFFYLPQTTSTEIPSQISSATTTTIGSVVSGNSAVGSTLKYFVYAYNPESGQLSPYATEFTVNNVFKNPRTQFDENNFVRLSFFRSGVNWLPIIFRRWGTQTIEYLGTLSNIKLGTSQVITFDDTGSVQIPSWDETQLNEGKFFPEFLKGIISVSSSEVRTYTMVGKRKLKIKTSSFTGNIELVNAVGETGSLQDLNNDALFVKFVFDDSWAIQKALDIASTNDLKEVFIPAGTYHVNNLRIYDSNAPSKYNGIVLRGAGESSVLKRSPSNVNITGQFGFVGVLGNSPSNMVRSITISDLAFDGNKTDVFPLYQSVSDVYGIGDRYNDFISLEYVDSIRIEDCAFYNGSGAAVYADRSEKINVTNNRVYKLSRPYESNISPVKIRESSKAIIQGNLFENCSGPLDFTGIEGSTINNNIINNCGDTGYLLNASSVWNAQGNLTLNQSGSLVRSTDLYNNEFSRVSLDVKKGVVMPPVYFTVTDGGMPVTIAKDNITARVYPLLEDYTYDTEASETYLQVVESGPQLDAGIFAITAPIVTVVGGSSSGSNANRTILGTSDYALLNPDLSQYGYGYKITATVSVGKYPISRIAWAGPSDADKIKIFLRNSADIMSIFNLAEGDENDLIRTSGISAEGSILEDWSDNVPIEVSSISVEDASILLETPSSLTSLFSNADHNYQVPGGYLSVVKSNYFIADGNIYVSE